MAAFGWAALWQIHQIQPVERSDKFALFVLIATSGSVVLNSPDRGLYIPPLTWRSQYHFSIDAVLVVLASHEHNDADYIRDYIKYLEVVLGSVR